VRVIDDVNFLLADAYGFDNNNILSHCFHNVNGVACGMGQPPARREWPATGQKLRCLRHGGCMPDSSHPKAAAAGKTGLGASSASTPMVLFCFRSSVIQSISQRALARPGASVVRDDE